MSFLMLKKFIVVFLFSFFLSSSFAKNVSTKSVLSNIHYKNDNFYSFKINNKKDKIRTNIASLFSGKVLSVNFCKKNKRNIRVCDIKIKEIKFKKNKRKIYTKIIKGFKMNSIPVKIKKGDFFEKKKYVKNNVIQNYQYCINKKCFNKKNRVKKRK